MKVKLNITLMCILVLSACASNRHLPETNDLAEKYSGKGFLVGSIAVRNTYRFYDDYIVLIRKLGDTQVKKVVLQPKDILKTSDEDGTFYLDGYRGAYFILPLNPGDYEVFSFLLKTNSSMESQGHKINKEFSFPFTIVDGQAHYMGEFVFNQPTALEYLSSISSRLSFGVENKHRRDISFFKEKYPKFNWVNAVALGN